MTPSKPWKSSQFSRKIVRKLASYAIYIYIYIYMMMMMMMIIFIIIIIIIIIIIKNN